MEEKRRSLKGMKGQYELLLPLARDRLADYYLGLNTNAQGDDRFVVVREVLPEVSGEKDRVSAFLSELRVTSRFTHPNLLRTLETGRTKISYFAIEEFLLGEGLGRLLQAARAASQEMPPHLAVGLVAQVCDGLEYAHQLRDSKGNPLQAVHRSLSPVHVVVGFSGRVKLVDFDVNEIAFQLVDGVTRGDLAYLSPEQVERQSPGPAADLFSLATILWELLACRGLFRRATDLETRQAVLAAAVPPLPRERGVSGELEAVVARALQRNPRARFQSAAQFGQALRDWLRQVNKEVGEYEIGVFVRGVLGEQEKKKRRLLEAAVQGELGSGDIASLVPDRKTRLGFEAPRPASRPPTPPPSGKPHKPPSLPSLPPMPPPIPELAAPAAPEPPKVEPPRPAPPPAAPPSPEPPPPAQAAALPAAAAEVPSAVDVPLGTFSAKPAPRDEDMAVVTPPAPREPTPAPREPTPAPREPTPAPGGAPAPAASPRPEGAGPSIRVRMPGEEGGRKGPPWKAILLGLGGALLLGLALYFLLRSSGAGPAEGAPDAGPAVAPAQALLEVRSTPDGCPVSLDGRELGRATPLAAEPVTPGVSHEVAVTCPGHERQVQTFQGQAGDRVVLAFRPTPLAAGAPDAGPTPGADAGPIASDPSKPEATKPVPPKPVPPKPVPPKPVPPTAATGFLQVNSLPWTEVWLGPKKLGITPLLGARLPVGKHTIKLVNPGAGISKTLEVTIQAGKTTSVFKQLQ